jgi:hypothetical protein
MLHDAAAEIGAALVVGGRELTESLRRKIRYSAYCDDLQHLESLARSLKSATPAANPSA